MSTSLTHPPTDISSQDIHWLNQLEVGARAVIQNLPRYDEDALIDVYSQSAGVGHWSWRIRCATAAELTRRVDEQGARGGRGDTEGATIKAKIVDAAKQLGISTRLIYQDAQVHRTFFSAYLCNETPLLHEVSYYVAALKTDDPIATIEEFAVKKDENRAFSPADAYRLVKARKTPQSDEMMPRALESESQVNAYRHWIEVTKHLGEAVPQWRGRITDMLDDMAYEAARPSDTWKARIIELITGGFNTCKLLSRELGLDTIQTSVMLNRLTDDDTLRREEADRGDGARGPVDTIYVINGV